MQERLELFDELYADWFLPNRWLFVQALLTFADLPKPFGDVLYLKTWDNPYWKYHNLRTALHVTPWLNRLLEAAQAAAQPLEAFFRQRVDEWLDGFAPTPLRRAERPVLGVLPAARPGRRGGARLRGIGLRTSAVHQ